MSTRRRRAAVALIGGLAFLIVPGVSQAAAPEVAPGTLSGVSVVKTGWWWRVNETPDQPAAAPPAVAPPNAPNGSLPVAAAVGDPEKIFAIEFALDAEPGATVTSFVLALKQNGAPAANANQESAKIIACPVTEFWADGQAAPWKTQPLFDCGAPAAGTAGPGGVWTFDLTSMASTWLAPGSSAPPSVVLVEKVEAPATFQVAFDGPAANGVGAKLVSTPAPPTTSPSIPDSSTGGESAGSSGGTGGTGTGDLGGGGGGGVPADAGAVPDPGPVPAAAGEPVAAGPEAPAAAGQAQAARSAGKLPIFDNIPTAALFLIPVVLVAAYLMMLALGPAGEPTLTTVRRGVSRALETRRAAGGRL
ncbi:hypothetical protein SAMN05192558_103280 [Actinokineospora alba]|uniref:DNRLRE domain-containing protein n=1 Tax=Actinokineospora alba TaxID=504798 RepID=A0A1H0JZT3_9PSEU|nr:hypothetical protein [Actinokineospora alba]TDP68100.1 hypothetical protein C8E96_3662 [Actinokineospora alba]SDH92302.1 hypothetical protein SAMN05421871_102769 [Actinokineospora alba]SDO49187.1 hypothetical protein SAMN05192558_103280 [Actinokineospora alba]